MARAGHGAEPAVTAAVLAALTTYATALGWYGLSVDPSAYTTPILLITLAVAAVGIGLRSLRLPRPAVVLLQAPPDAVRSAAAEGSVVRAGQTLLERA